MRIFRFSIVWALLQPIFALGEFRFFYGESPRNLEVNSFEKTLLVFPSPPFTQICQPSNVVSLNTLANTGEAQQILPNSMGFSYIERLETTRKQDTSFQSQPEDGRDNLVASFLKLTPLRQSGETTCAFKLANGESVLVKFVLTETMQRPAVEFVSMANTHDLTDLSLKLGGLNIFRELLSGGDLTYFIEVTPTPRETSSTDLARYRLYYLGTDSQNFKAWRIRGEAKKDFIAPLYLDSNQLGQLFYSAWVTQEQEKPRELKANQAFSLFILTSNDVAVSELFKKLP